MCIFLEAVGFNPPLLFSGHKTSQRAPLLLLRDVEAHDQLYLHIFISSTNFYNHFLAPGVEINGGEVRSAPKEATRATRRCPWATTSPRSPAKEEMKVWSIRRQQDYLLYRLLISRFCVWTNVVWLLYQHTHISR
jgi:hypothetical protein